MASTVTVAAPAKRPVPFGWDTSTPSACSVTELPSKAPLPTPVATSRSPTRRRAEVTGPVTVTRMETRPATFSPASGCHVVPSVEYSTLPMTGFA